jgi:hypothetical protein
MLAYSPVRLFVMDILVLVHETAGFTLPGWRWRLYCIHPLRLLRARRHIVKRLPENTPENRGNTIKNQ